MGLEELVGRAAVPVPWAEGDNIPWHEPAFSQRMLREHLTQEHDLASRRFEVIDAHTDWIHRELLSGRAARILDLGCGPGLYANRLAQVGHDCVGIDFSPASIAYARDTANQAGLTCRYILEDLRLAQYGDGFDLVMLIYGEFNVFRPSDARLLLSKAFEALVPGGALLLEVSTFEALRRQGMQDRSWYTAASGLFGDGPYLCLMEHSWDEDSGVATVRYYVLDTAGRFTPLAVSYQAYTPDQLVSILRDRGFGDTTFHATLTGADVPEQKELAVVVARKPGLRGD
jgi:SAM-dependent methyltransferase